MIGNLIENKKMSEINSSTWRKWIEAPTERPVETEEDIINAVKKETDCMDDEEIREYIGSEWMTICMDGIIIWTDGE